jgi:hypothetical protein
MDLTQYARARAVIEGARLLCSDALLTSDASDPRGYVCCAIGELALDAGHEGHELRVTDGDPSDYPCLFPKLEAAFGLDGAQCESIVMANDSPSEMVETADFLLPGVTLEYPFYPEPDEVDWPRARKAAVLAQLDEIAGVARDVQAGD